MLADHADYSRHTDWVAHCYRAAHISIFCTRYGYGAKMKLEIRIGRSHELSVRRLIEIANQYRS